MVAAFLILASANARAQCTDGTPPPCRDAPPGPSAMSVAVLAFQTRDTSLAYRSEGLADDITAVLGHLPRIEVKSSAMVRRAQASARGDLGSVGRTLGVRWIVDGSVRPIGARMRITAQLVDTRTGALAWGDTYDRTDDELLVLPGVIATEVASRLGSGVTHADRSRITRLRTRSPEADEHFLRGNVFLAERSVAMLERAAQEYLEAVRIDPRFATALGRAAYARVLATFYSFVSPARTDSLMAAALALADSAVRLDSASSDAWMGRAAALAYWKVDSLPLARVAYGRSLALDPRSAEAHHQFAQLLNDLGDHDAAERELRTALAIEPGRIATLGDLLFETRPRDLALGLRLADSVVALGPTEWVGRYLRAVTRLRTGDAPGALDEARLAIRLDSNLETSALLALALARSGDTAAARAFVQAWSGAPVPIYSIGFAPALVALGDTAAALAVLERMPPSPGRWGRLHFPELDPLHGTPRYERLLAASRPPGAVGP
jgi:TolB-like protein